MGRFGKYPWGWGARGHGHFGAVTGSSGMRGDVLSHRQQGPGDPVGSPVALPGVSPLLRAATGRGIRRAGGGDGVVIPVFSDCPQRALPDPVPSSMTPSSSQQGVVDHRTAWDYI